MTDSSVFGIRKNAPDCRASDQVQPPEHILLFEEPAELAADPASGHVEQTYQRQCGRAQSDRLVTQLQITGQMGDDECELEPTSKNTYPSGNDSNSTTRWVLDAPR